MAQKSISRLDAFHFAGQDPVPAASGAGDDMAPGSFPAEPQIGRASHTAADLALDLVLHEMLQQARLTSSATGAAVVLPGESGIRCRATAGATAAEVDAYLRANCKLVEGCLRSGSVQRCDDTESDTRFDVVACRRLGLRSVLICPVQDRDDKTLGVIELFSSRPGAFGDGDILMLQAIGQRIVDNLGFVQRLADPGETQFVPRDYPRHEIAELPTPLPSLPEPPSPPQARAHGAFQIDSKLFLLVAAITLSIILGWMLGRTQGLRVKSRTRPRTAPAVQVIQPQPSPSQASPESLSQPAEVSVPAAEAADSVSAATVEITRTPQPRKIVAAPQQPVVRTGGASSLPAESSADSVVVFEDDKSNSSPAHSLPPVSSLPQGSSIQASPGMANHNGAAHISPEKATANLLLRIEPDYPEKAREQKLQGSVVLDIAVGKDGMVHGISTISGDPQLALAAAHAVQQWRFKPWVRKGKPAPFESRITLNFSLP